mgnify:CR=1 FL=1
MFLILVVLFFVISNNETVVRPQTDVVANKPELKNTAELENIRADDLYRLVNSERTKNGLSPLNKDARLDISAMDKFNDMVARNYWDHNTPDGSEPWVYIDKHSPSYTFAAENLAYSFFDSQLLVWGWMASPTHRENILDQKVTHVGYAVCESPNFIDQGKQIIVVQHFVQL